MKRGFTILLVLFFGVIFSACDGSGGCGTTTTIELTEADNGKTIEINLNEQIEVALSSNPTTGYQWINMLTEGSFIVQVGDSVFETDPDCGQMDGCGGTQFFTFKATQTGTGAIKLFYMRAWDGEPLRQFSVTVVVN